MRSATASGSSSRSSRSPLTCRCSTTSSSGWSSAAAASSTAPSSASASPSSPSASASGRAPSAAVRTLRTADQQKVEILRQLVRDTRLIVMDEPTAALTRDEADRLLEITRELRDDGVTVIYVSHILGDVLALCDTVTVLKDGRHVKTTPAAAGDARQPGHGDARALAGRRLPDARAAARRCPSGAGGARPEPAAGLPGHLLRGPRGGDRRARGPRGQRPHGDRARHLRGRPVPTARSSSTGASSPRARRGRASAAGWSCCPRAARIRAS